MTEMLTDPLTPKPMTMDDVQKLVGSLYLEIEMLRRQVQQLRAHIESNSHGSLPA
jgi:hypothetical protein